MYILEPYLRFANHLNAKLTYLPEPRVIYQNPA